MTTPYGARNYFRTQVESASPIELVVLLYDGGVRAADAAHEAMVAGDIPARRTAMSKLMAIIAELQNTLDVTKGGRVAEELDGLYTYMLSRLLKAITDQDAKPIDEVRRLLATLADAWREAARTPAAQGMRP
jgi:flagellar secretion chaperone FliS